MAGALASAPTQLYSDCANVVSMHGIHDLQRLSPKRPYAGLVLQGRALGRQRLLGREKVRAHLALDSPDIDEAERFRRV
eukprot:9330065-Pyramimonas_sp.AAC.1